MFAVAVCMNLSIVVSLACFWVTVRFNMEKELSVCYAFVPPSGFERKIHYVRIVCIR